MKLFEKIMSENVAITVYRGEGNTKWTEKMKRPYCNCLTFWSDDKEYAKEFGDKISERSIIPANYFELSDDNLVRRYEMEMGEDVAPAEQNLTFCAWLVVNGYHGYTRLDDDDGTKGGEASREYVVIDLKDKELRDEIEDITGGIKWEVEDTDDRNTLLITVFNSKTGETTSSEMYLLNDFSRRWCLHLLSEVGYKHYAGNGIDMAAVLYKDIRSRLPMYGLDPKDYIV